LANGKPSGSTDCSEMSRVCLTPSSTCRTRPGAGCART
jgi:hypothetical protein